MLTQKFSGILFLFCFKQHEKLIVFKVLSSPKSPGLTIGNELKLQTFYHILKQHIFHGNLYSVLCSEDDVCFSV